MLPFSFYPYYYLEYESWSLLSRLCLLKPFSMTMPMVKGASVSNEAFEKVMGLMEDGKAGLYHAIKQFIKKIQKARCKQEHPAELQAAFSILKLRYNSVMDDCDIYADVFAQRSEHEVGIWLCGLDRLAEDAMELCKDYFDPPALMVFLERGHGAAIRRAETKLPSGISNPVAVIQIPRERLVGSGIASSLIHETGHQAAEKLGLVRSLKSALAAKQQDDVAGSDAWALYGQWIPELIADFYAMAQLGIAATMGLMGLVTLPRYYQFRLNLHDAHPPPYVRVKISCAFGEALYPHAQWDRLWNVWKLFYPTEQLPTEKQRLLQQVHDSIPGLVSLINNHRPLPLNGKRLMEIFPLEDRQPARLQQYYRLWELQPQLIDRAPPTLVFAVIGQAKADLKLHAVEENRVLSRQLRKWAFKRK